MPTAIAISSLARGPHCVAWVPVPQSDQHTPFVLLHRDTAGRGQERGASLHIKVAVFWEEYPFICPAGYTNH